MHVKGIRAPLSGSRAACSDHNPDLFFPSEDAPAELVRVQEATAKAICRSCPVAGLCLSTALTRHMSYGVWGGLSAEDRKAVLASRAKAQLTPSAGKLTAPAKRTRRRRRTIARRSTQATTAVGIPVGVSA
jgi:WhiB family redox-sensing transcriptional regulator